MDPNNQNNQQQPYEPQGQPPYGPQGQPPYGPMPPMMPMDPPGKKESTIALVCGIISVVLSFCGGILSLVLGIVAIVQARNAKRLGFVGGAATAGMVLGIIGLVVGVISFIYWVFIAGITGSILSSY